MDRIDSLYYAHSSRINVKEETRIKATSEEAQQWEEAHKAPDGLSPDQNDFPCLVIDVFSRCSSELYL